jgi:hypothetical protein
MTPVDATLKVAETAAVIGAMCIVLGFLDYLTELIKRRRRG